MKTAAERFLARVDRPTGCWTWTGSMRSDGYGKFNWNGSVQAAHRISYQLFRGPIPPGMQLQHSCDNRRCVNPDHLFLGTQLDNRRNMVAKGRHHPTGRKLSGQRVVEIRDKYASGNYTHKELAEEYNVGMGTISRIVSRKTWRSV